MSPAASSSSPQATAPCNATVRSTCCYCGVGCGVLIDTVLDGQGVRQITGVRGDPSHPANRGRLCSKGITLHLTVQPHVLEQTRVLHPEMRTDRTQVRVPVSWQEANEHVAQRFAQIVQTHGPEAVALYVSGQLLTEDYYLFNKLAKGVLGTNNIDTNSRLCMSSAVAGYKQTLGVDAPPCAYEDIDHAGAIFITGSNTALAHPVLFRRIEAARARNPQQRLVVIDPRRTETAAQADLFLQIEPGSDIALHHGLLHILLWEGWVDRTFIDRHTEGFESLRDQVVEFTPKAVALRCGISQEDLHLAARWFAQSGPVLSLYCQGLNQSTAGTANNASLINLHLAAGQIGKPGAGPFSLTGQPNAMGGREVGGLANLLSAHRDLSNPLHRQEVADLWDIDAVPQKPGLMAVQLFDALHTGQVKAVWIVCTNPAQSLPHQKRVHEALQRAEFVVVQEAYHNTATVPFADVLLPAASWGEKEGTVTNSERCISRVRAAVSPPGEARADWRIGRDIGVLIAAYLGRRTRTGGSLLDYASPEALWEEHRASTQGRDLDITGLSYALLDSLGPQQWPFPKEALRGTTRLYTDSQFPTPSGRARFVRCADQGVAEPTDARFPFSMTTGRLRDQWHGMSRTGTLARLYAHDPEPAVQLSRGDCERLGLVAGELVYVTSRRGCQILPVQPSESLASMQCFIPMHWGEERLGGQAGNNPGYGVNGLTFAATDPVSGQPALKQAAVKIIQANLPWHLHALIWSGPEEALLLQSQLGHELGLFSYGACGLFGHESAQPDSPVGVRLKLAHVETPTADQLLHLEARLGFLPDSRGTLQYHDRRRGITRQVRMRTEGAKQDCLQAVLLAGEAAQVKALRWLETLLEEQHPVASLGRALLMPGHAPPQGLVPRGRTVCTCNAVTETEILNQLSGMAVPHTLEQHLSGLQKALGCGTTCGSCLPELKRLVLHHVGSPEALSTGLE